MFSYGEPTAEQIVRRDGSVVTVRETDKNGDYTGAKYYHCNRCGGECMTGWPKANAHRNGCPEADN